MFYWGLDNLLNQYLKILKILRQVEVYILVFFVLEKEIILNSVQKTGRLVVVDPAHKVCSAASEIISIVSEQGFWNLQAPPAKVAAEQVHIPFTQALEPLIFPTEEKIINAVKGTLE